jgi:hypothetical protein
MYLYVCISITHKNTDICTYLYVCICITQKNIDMSPDSCEIFTCLLRFLLLLLSA